MIKSKEDYKYYCECDRISLGVGERKTPRFYTDDIWRFEILMRQREYVENCSPYPTLINKIVSLYLRYRYSRLSIKLGFTIPINVFGPGLCLVHPGSIVVAKGARIGANCRIHEGVTIGATNKSNTAATIGDNVFIGSGAKIIGELTISSDVTIGANAVVVKDVISDNGCTVGGIPAKIISQNNSSTNIVYATLIVNKKLKQ